MNRKNSQLELLEESFERLSEELDITPSRFDTAKNRYEAIGNWLGREGSLVRNFSPNLYPQGSFALGTVIKPISDNEDYDVDLVCQVCISKTDITQKQLKEMIGIEINKYSETNNMDKKPKEGKRCWSIEYADGAQFHMDILPSIPNGKPDALSEFSESEIAITDSSQKNYSVLSLDWPRSNPRGYTEWFKGRMAQQFQQKLAMFAESRGIEIDEVPEHRIKTPLQRAIQLLKRHRDILFAGKDSKPRSIIISTLAAYAYSGEDNIVEALNNIVAKMENYFEVRNGHRILKNPVNENEVFTDRWSESDENDFFNWLYKAKEEFLGKMEFSESADLEVAMERNFGEKLAHKVMGKKENERNNIIVRQSPPTTKIDSQVRPWRKGN